MTSLEMKDADAIVTVGVKIGDKSLAVIIETHGIDGESYDLILEILQKGMDTIQHGADLEKGRVQ